MITHKRGDTFEIIGTYDDITSIGDITIKSHVKDFENNLIAELVYSVVDIAENRYSLLALNTQEWPVKKLFFDIQYTFANGKTVSTETVTIDCVRDITV